MSLVRPSYFCPVSHSEVAVRVAIEQMKSVRPSQFGAAKRFASPTTGGGTVQKYEKVGIQQRKMQKNLHRMRIVRTFAKQLQ